jgi:hypothetical protein
MAVGLRYAWQSVSDEPTRYGGGFTAVPIEGGTELRYDGWATTSGELAGREQAWEHAEAGDQGRRLAAAGRGDGLGRAVGQCRGRELLGIQRREQAVIRR